MHPILVPVGIVGGLLAATGVALRLHAKAKAKTTPQAALVASIQQGLANGTVKLSTTGVPFQSVSPPATPAQIMAGLVAPNGLIGILKTDLITVNNSSLAASLQSNASNLPGFQPNENIIMVVSDAGQPGTGDFPSGKAPASAGPIMALSQDDRLQLTAAMQIPIAAITGVQPADAAVLEQAAAKLAQGKP